MTQWRGLLAAAAAFPDINGAAKVAVASMEHLSAFLESGVYPDGVETEMASGVSTKDVDACPGRS